MSFDFISALYDEPPPLRGNAPSTAHSNNHDVFVDEIMRSSDSTTASTNMEYMQRFERNRDNLDFFREELESELRSELRDQLRRRSSEFSENSSRHLNSSNLNLNPNLNNSNNFNDSDNQSNDTVQGAVPAPVPSRRDAAASPGFDGRGASRGLSDIVGVLPRCDPCRGSASDSEGDVRSNPTPNSGYGRNDNGGNNHNSLPGTDRRRSGNGDDGSSPSAAAGTSAGGTPDNHVAVAQPPSMSASALAATSAEELNIQLTRWLNEAVPLAGPVATAPTAASVTAWTPAHSSPATQRGNDDDDDADTSTFGSLLPNALVTSASNRAVALDALRTADPIELIRLDADLNAALFNDWSALPSLNALSSALSLDPVTHDRNYAGASLPLHHGVGRINGIGRRNRGVDIVSSHRFDALRSGGANFSELQNGATLPRDNTAVVGGLAVAGANDQILYANNDSSDNNEFIISDNRHGDGSNSINLPSVSLSRLPRGPTNLAGLLTAGNSLARLSNQDGLVDSQPPTSVAASASTSTWGNNIDNDGSGNNWVPVAGSSASNNNGGNTITSLTSLYDSTSVQSATDILRRLLSQHESSRGLPAPQRPLVRASNDTSSGSSISCSNNSDNRSCSGGSSSSSSSRGHSDNSNQPRGQFSSSSSSSGDNENNNGRSDWIAQSMPFDDDIESIGTVDQDSGADEIAADDGLNTSIVANTFESTSSFDVGAFSAPTASSSTSASNTNSAAAATASSIATATTPTSSLESTATTSVAQPQGHRVRRQAAIRGMERISTALATHGMGPVDKSINMDHKPIATKKRSTSQGHANDSKKRSIVEVDDDLNTKQPAIKMEKSIPAAAKEPKQEDEAPPTCCICLEEPTYEELASINVCKHPFCFSCIEKWADRENTCPLCKTRFVKIERVNKPKRKRKGADSDGVTQEKPRNVKRVRQRDQRHDYSFSNPLQGIFASMEANGTWPTHIAQLLFSGLGANTMRGRERGRAGIRPFGVAAATSTGPPVSSAATDSLTSHRERSGMAPPPVRLSTRYNRSVPRATSSAASESSRAGTNSSSAHAMGSILNRVSVSRHDSYEIGGSATSSAFGAPRYSSSRPHHSSSTASSTHASFDRTPWSAHASISVTYGPDGFVGHTSSPDSRLSGFGGHGRPASASTRGNSTGGLNHFNIDEEQDLLSSLSPSSYIRRIHHQMERSNRGTSNNSYSGQHHFSTVSSPDSSARFAQSNASTSAAVPTASSLRGSTSSRHDPWEQYFRTSSLSNYLPTPIGPDIESDNRRAAGLRTTASNAAGSTAETALEIDDDSDDDDVVEVLEIAANV